MAINFLNNVDYNKNQLLNPRIQNEVNDAAAGTPREGQLYYNTTDNELRVGIEVIPATTPPTYEWSKVSQDTYQFTLSDNANPAITGTIASGDTIKIAASGDLTSNLTGQATTSKQLEVGLKLDGGAGVENNYIVNQGSATAAADDTIPFSNYTDNVDPVLDTYVVKKTTFGDIPAEALTLVKNYIDTAVAGGLIYKGGYDADQNTPNLDSNPNPNNIKTGWAYTVTVDGVFFNEQVRVGDLLIAKVDAPTALADWTTVQNNVDFATAGTNTGADAAVIGISRYNEDDFTVSASGFVELNTSATGVITAGSLSGTVNHNFGINTLVQTINSSGDTVHCDVTRTTTSGVGSPSTSVATIAAAEATDITILVQKIG